MKTIEPYSSSRRDFLKTIGYVSIGFPLFGSCWPKSEETIMDQELPGSLRDYPNINAWIQVLENGNVRVLTGKLELGQGIQTAIMQVAAEELDMDMGLVEILIAETGRTPNEGYTAGSRSIESSAMAVRYAAASAKEKILMLAAKELNANASELQLKDGMISDGNGGSIHLKDTLKGKQIEDEVSLPVSLKDKKQYRFVGKSIPRRDIEQMVKGAPIYVQDLRFPGMVHARVIRPKGYDSKLIGYDKDELNALPGLLKIVENGSFLAIIADEEYQAVKLKERLAKIAKWSDPEKLPINGSLEEYIRNLPADSNIDVDSGQAQSSLENADLKHKASYSKPYIMHGANGPSCAVALFEDGKLEIWSHSQGVYPLRESIAGMLEMSTENIHIKGVPGSGCYGHNGADDVAAEAALLAVAYPGKHVRLQWMREDEHGWEPYGTFMIMDLEASLDSAGKITAWKYNLWSDGHSTRPGGNPASLLPARYIENGFQPPSGGFRGGALRNAPPCYDISNQLIQSHIFKGPLRISALRGLGAYANIFAIESFMDELAEKADKDPIAFRIDHLSDERAIQCLEKLSDMIKQVKPQPGEGIGVAFSRYKNSATYCAIAAWVGVNDDSGAVNLKKMWATVDAGETINIDGLKNQIEGGMVQSASWALMEEVQFDENHITSLNWNSYPMLRYNNAPETEIEVINRPDQPPLGAGEAAQGPASAAIANAIYWASGKRIRDLPINPGKVKQ